MDLVVDMRSVFEKRKGQYKNAHLSMVLVPEKGVRRLFLGSLVFEKDSCGLPGQSNENLLDYGNIVFLKRDLLVNDAWDFVEKLSSCEVPREYDFSSYNPGFKSPDWVRDVGELSTPVGSHRHFQWPTKVFAIYDKNQNVPLPEGPIVRRDMPLIVDSNNTVDKWTGVAYGSVANQNSLVVFLPDYRARIAKIAFGDYDATVELETHQFKLDRIVAKAAVEAGMETKVLAEKNRYLVPYERLPREFFFFLIDSSTGDTLDWARVYLNWSNLPPEIEFKSSRKRIEQMIDGGETDTMEFKSESSDGFLFIQSVVAFANTRGGTILLGVEDDTSICGTDPEKEKQRVEEWVETKCDPPIQLKFETIEIDGKKILSVQVPEGTNKPYQHRSNGVFYVRRGATDRPMRRSELDSLDHAPPFRR